LIGQIYSKLTFLIVTKTDLENFTSSFYIIYILPIKTNLYRWGFKTDGRCLHCGLDEDVFIQCNLFCLFDHTNKDGISYWHCNYRKTSAQNQSGDWNIFVFDNCLLVHYRYFFILIRNMSGKDNRKLNLEYNV